MATNFDPPAFDMSKLQSFYPQQELPNASLRLPANRRIERNQSRRKMTKLKRTRYALETLGHLPAAGESIHCALAGSFSLWNFVEAILQLTGQPIEELSVVTLSFSKKNIEALRELIDAGQIKQLAIVCSCYFAAADQDIFSQAVELCAQHGFPIKALRSHAKMILARTGTGHIVIESSANLRSCNNVEQATVFNDAALYDFHAGWIGDLLAQEAAK